jgi:hypothetical protein
MQPAFRGLQANKRVPRRIVGFFDPGHPRFAALIVVAQAA